MLKFTTLTSKTLVLPQTNIDTDVIIPARFLKVTGKQSLGKQAFYDWRYPGGTIAPEFVLNQPRALEAKILVAGDNFGCGSSREHAPWALLDFGFRVVISTSIADIFLGNSLKNGLLPVTVDKAYHNHLLNRDGLEMTVDLAQGLITDEEGGESRFETEPFARHCMLQGLDQLDFLLEHMSKITAFEQKRDARV